MVAWLAKDPLCTRHWSDPTAYGWQPAALTADSVAIRVPDALPALRLRQSVARSEVARVADALEHRDILTEAGHQRGGHRGPRRAQQHLGVHRGMHHQGVGQRQHRHLGSQRLTQHSTQGIRLRSRYFQ